MIGDEVIVHSLLPRSRSLQIGLILTHTWGLAVGDRVENTREVLQAPLGKEIIPRKQAAAKLYPTIDPL